MNYESYILDLRVCMFRGICGEWQFRFSIRLWRNLQLVGTDRDYFVEMFRNVLIA